MFMFYGIVYLDMLKRLFGEDPWFPFTEGVVHGTIGAIVLYGAVIWTSVIVINVRTKKKHRC